MKYKLYVAWNNLPYIASTYECASSSHSFLSPKAYGQNFVRGHRKSGPNVVGDGSSAVQPGLSIWRDMWRAQPGGYNVHRLVKVTIRCYGTFGQIPGGDGTAFRSTLQGDIRRPFIPQPVLAMYASRKAHINTRCKCPLRRLWYSAFRNPVA